MEEQPRDEVTGRRKRATYQELVQWVDECWKDISISLVKESFNSCGLSTDLDNINLHSKLIRIINDQMNIENDEVEEENERTGLTDDEEKDDVNPSIIEDVTVI